MEVPSQLLEEPAPYHPPAKDTERLVKIPHPEKDQGIAVLFLCCIVLVHGRGHLAHGAMVYLCGTIFVFAWRKGKSSARFFLEYMKSVILNR